jgi:fructokinase
MKPWIPPVVPVTGQPLLVSWGELLWDLYPHRAFLGGCAANVAYHWAQLQAKSVLVSRVGHDERGRQALEQLQESKVQTEHVQIDPELPTGVVHVTLVDGEPHFRMETAVAWREMQCPPTLLPVAQQAQAIVFGTMVQHSPLGFSTFRILWEQLHPDCLRVCDLNLRQPLVEERLILEAIQLANIIKINEPELRYLKKIVHTSDALGWLSEQPSLKMIAYTQGAKGCTLITRGASSCLQTLHIPAPTIDDKLGDRIGAGDAFTAALTWALVTGYSIEIAGEFATRYASHVATCEGAMPAIPEHVRLLE